jgi:cyclohexanone monooxygenase
MVHRIGRTVAAAPAPKAESAKELYVFQRTPVCADLRFNTPTDPEWAASLKPGWQWERMANFAGVLEGHPDIEVDLVNDGWTTLYRKAFGPALKKAAEKVGQSRFNCS